MRHAITVVLVATFLLPAANSFSGTQDHAVIGLHAQPRPQEGGDPCTWDGSSCLWFNVHQLPVPASYDIYLIVGKGDPEPGVAAMSCGIDYGPYIKMHGWTNCASGPEWPSAGANGSWPAPLSGIRVSWDSDSDCQRTVIGNEGVHALAGSFYVTAYADDFIILTPSNNLQSGPELQVADCDHRVSEIGTSLCESWSWVGFGTIRGREACTTAHCVSPPSRPIPVRPTTWGSIKAQY